MRILITRLGGVGDLLYMEPTIRALSEKYKTKDIVLRTYKDYADVLKSHPCISGVVLDDNKYMLGYFRGSKFKNIELWNGVNPHFDIHIDFTDLSNGMERIAGSPNHHIVDMFASMAGLKLTDKNVKVFFNKISAPHVCLLAQLVSDGSDRDLSANKELRDIVELNPSSAFLGDVRLSYDEFMSRISECDVFLGTESCGVIAAHAMGKKTIGIYKNEEKLESRSFKGMICFTQSDLKFRIDEINKQINNMENNMQDTSKLFEYRKRKGHFDKFLRGNGIDIGCGNDKLVVLDGSVDRLDVSNDDAMVMPGVLNEKYDFVYSSHCLENMVDVGTSLYNLTRILKTDGYLYVVVPDFVLYEKMRFPSYWNKDHKSTFSDTFYRDKVKRENHFHLDDIKFILSNLNMDIVEAVLEDDGYNYDLGPDIDQTKSGAMSQLLIVARKKNATPTSQMGADDWVLSNYKKGYFVDAGCCDGEDISNTYKLEKLGWTGLCIDVFPKNFDKRPKSKVIEAALHGIKDLEVDFTVSKAPEISGITDYLGKQGTAAYTGWKPYVDKTIKVKTQLLHEILDANNAPNFIEYLNMDIEGVELEVLKTFPFKKYKFGCISLEHNYDEPKRTLIRKLLEANGYRLHEQVKADDWFMYDEKRSIAESEPKPCENFQDIKKEYKIGLCMIVKNEEKIIRRCLDSVKPFIDYVCITDTGSTDKTVETIKSWMVENCVDGFVCFEPWKDFAHNRTVALQKMRACSNVEYALMIDADEVLEYDSDFDASKTKQGMDKDLYNVTCRYGNIIYARTSITKNNKPYFYKGVVHEFLECSEPIKTRDTLNGVYNIPLQDSARNGTNKFKHDVDVLENALQTEKDPFMISRYTFYLAQSYRDFNNNAQALKFYLERSSQGFWQDEVFISLLQAARLKEQLQYPDDDIVQSYMRAHEAAPQRIEALHGAARFCRSHSRNQQAYILSKWGQGLPVRKDGLFVESWIWDYGIDDEVSISSYWSGYYEDGIKVTKDLLKKIPAAQIPRVQKNLEYLEGKFKV
jgi:glycosyltransferase involved in cell wall biosynthesis